MMAPSSQILTQGGILTRDWFSDKLAGRGFSTSKHVDNSTAQLDIKDIQGSDSMMLQRSDKKYSGKLIDVKISLVWNFTA